MTGVAIAFDASSGSPSYSAGQFRLALSGLFTPSGALGVRSGILNAESFTPSISGGTLSIAPGRAVVQGATTTTQGAYLAVMSATQTLSIPAANDTYARLDLVYLRIWDTETDASGQTQVDYVYLAGTAAASPALPSIPSGQTGLPLLTVQVPKSGAGSPVASVTGPYTAARGGAVPVYNASDEATLTEPGQLSLRLDTGRVRRRSGSAFGDVADRHWARVSKTSTFTLAANSPAALVWDSAVNSPGDTIGAGGSSSLTLPYTGDYDILIHLMVPSVAAGNTFSWASINNGSNMNLTYLPSSPGGAGQAGYLPIGGNAGDTVTLGLTSVGGVTGWANPIYARIVFVGPSS